MKTDRRRTDRQRTERWGRLAEGLALLSLYAKGYHLVARRWRPPGRVSGAGEIDLIVRRGRVVAFVEVKARRDLATALDALRPAQQARIIQAARWFAASRSDLGHCDLRYDVVVLRAWRWPRHIVGAFLGE